MNAVFTQYSLLAGLVLVGLIQILTAVRLIYAIFWQRKSTNSELNNRVAIILCLRGGDPFLVDCLKALVDQDYLDYQLRIVVDSDQDPAWQAIEESNIRSLDHVFIDVLRQVPKTCGLKNAALLQAITCLDEDKTISAIALVDADTIVHRSWLRELTAPLGHDDIEVTTGIRWYLPERPTLGSLVRLVWNAAATAQMVGMQIPWGGSLAISRKAIESLDIPKHWSTGLSEDTMLTKLLRKRGMRQMFVSSIIMVNRENCGIRELMRWIKRQLVISKLYHPSWWVTIVHAGLTGLIPLLCLIAIGYYLWTGNIAAGLAIFVELGVYQTAMTGFLVAGLWLIDRRLGAERGKRPGLDFSLLIRLPVAILVTQVLYPIALFAAIRATSVDWRGIHYRIQGDGSISHQGHLPFQAGTQSVSRATAGVRALDSL